jgi:hypothetical protein
MRKFRILFVEVIGLGILIGWLMWKYPELVDDIIPWVALVVAWHLTWEFVIDTRAARRVGIALGGKVNKMVIWPLVFVIGGGVSLVYWRGINVSLGRLAAIAAERKKSTPLPSENRTSNEQKPEQDHAGSIAVEKPMGRPTKITPKSHVVEEATDASSIERMTNSQLKTNAIQLAKRIRELKEDENTQMQRETAQFEAEVKEVYKETPGSEGYKVLSRNHDSRMMMIVRKTLEKFNSEYWPFVIAYQQQLLGRYTLPPDRVEYAPYLYLRPPNGSGMFVEIASDLERLANNLPDSAQVARPKKE